MATVENAKKAYLKPDEEKPMEKVTLKVKECTVYLVLII